MSDDEALARRLSTMRVSSRSATWAQLARRRALPLWVSVGALLTLTLLGLEIVSRETWLTWAIAAVWLATVAGLVGLVVRACRRWEAAERAGRRTPWPIDPSQV
ncbi:hypothetical protein [Streptomyces sp. NBC_00566]|uniref:hypothetical protein n=1 Tax=Streptomyces sp. NBC_00566 TaxID=2975778 RepID=UPI002E818638|nr:hypothetical protein [Streptomyces sp. NBC_00566]WUB89967.1 hypothetical protein OG812_26690 [Streptomyces sp. NBC_00566]